MLLFRSSQKMVLLYLFFYFCTLSLLFAQEQSQGAGPVSSDTADIRPLPETNGPLDFLDKWVISGNAIGNSVGAVIGQTVGAAVFPPFGWVVGSFLGTMVGGLIGTYCDNKRHKGYNYGAFNRRPVGEGGL